MHAEMVLALCTRRDKDEGSNTVASVFLAYCHQLSVFLSCDQVAVFPTLKLTQTVSAPEYLSVHSHTTALHACAVMPWPPPVTPS